MARQAQNGAGPRDDGYLNTYQPKVKLTDPDQRIKDDPVGRLEARREQMGGDLSPEFIAAMAAAGDAERAKYGPDGRGAIGVTGGAAWTNIGPYRSNWIQNGSRSRSPTPDVSARFYSTVNGGTTWVSRLLTALLPPGVWPGFNATLAYAARRGICTATGCP